MKLRLLAEGTGSPRLSLGFCHLCPVLATGEQGQGAGCAPIARSRDPASGTHPASAERGTL